MRSRWLTAAAAAAAVVLATAAGGTPSAFPKFSAPVVDAVGLVSQQVVSEVSASLEDYQNRSGNQIAIALVHTTGNRALEDYSIDLARAWGVGQKGKDNGVLLLIAYDDHKVRIEVGRGLEGNLTDLQSGRIINDRLIPLLRQGDVSGAVAQGALALRQTLGDTTVGPLPTVAPPPAPVSHGSPLPGLAIAGAVLAFSVLGGFGRRRRWGGFMGPIFWGGGLGGFGGGGGGFGGGGFGGGGGGGFGGGGASGGW